MLQYIQVDLIHFLKDFIMTVNDCMNAGKYEVASLKGEVVTKFNGQRWEYCKMTTPAGDTKRYYHVDCDSVTDNKGFCLMCGSPSPCAT